MMRKTFVLAAGAAMLLGLATAGADALPLAPAASLSDAPATVLVSGGCGPYGHRNYYGECRPGGRGYYGRPVYRGPVYGFAGPRFGPRGYYGRRCFIRETYYGPRRVCR